MKIAFDSFGSGAALPGSSVTFSHTCSGSNRGLVVAINVNGAAGDVITSVTYNGIAMAREIAIATGYGSIYLYYLSNPPTGANNVVISANTSSGFIRGVSASYTGVNQINQPTSTGQGNLNSVTSITISTTVIYPNSWVIGAVGDDGNLVLTEGAGLNAQRVRYDQILDLGDSNGDKPPGTYSMTWSSGSQSFGAVMISLTPAPEGGALLGLL